MATATAPRKPVQVNKPAGPSANFATVLKQAAPYMDPHKLADLAEQFAREEAKRMGLGAPSAPSEQTITGPATAYDDATGEPQFRMGEAGAERVSITPQGGGQSGPSAGPVPGYEGGGSLLIKPPGIDPNVHPQIAPPTFNNLRGPALPVPPAGSGAAPWNGKFTPPGPTTVNPTVGQYWAQKRVYDTQNQINIAARGQANAQGLTNAAQQRTLGPSADVLEAKDRSLDARSRQNASQSAYLAELERENATRQGEYQQVQAASQDAADITAVAQARNYRNSQSQRYNAVGATQPVEADLPAGFSGPLPGGVVAKLSTHEDQLKKQFDASDKGRSFAIEAARIVSAQSGQAVTAADILEGRAQLTLDQANLAARSAGLDQNDAELALKTAGLNKDDAQLELEQGKLPPQPGEVLYQDPRTGMSTWMTPLERAEKMRSDELAFGTENKSTRYSQHPTFGSLSDSEVVTQLASQRWSDPQAIAKEVVKELVSRGYPVVTAQMIVDAALARNRSGGGPSAPQEG